MNGPFDEELISAYHDGELDGSEHDAVEDRIEDGSELREVLDEFAELSSSLNSLPRPQAPADLRGAVLQQVRETSAARVKAPEGRPSTRRLWFWTAGTAASLLVAAGLFALISGPRAERGMQVADYADDSEAAPGAALATASTDPAGADMAAAEPAGGGIESMSTAEVPADEVRLSADSIARDSQLQDQIRNLLQPDDLDVGRQLQVLQSVDDELLLIEFQVVDVDRTFGQVQILLDELGITRLESEQDVAAAEPASQDRLRGILLDVSPETLLTALDRIDELPTVLLVDTNGADMALELGVDPARLPERIQQQAMAFAEERSPEPDAIVPPAAEAPPSRAGTSPAQSVPTLGAEQSEAEGIPAEYQVTLSLHDEVVRELEQQQERENAPRAEDAANEDPAARNQQPGSDQPPAEDAAPRTRSRLLIIFASNETRDPAE